MRSRRDPLKVGILVVVLLGAVSYWTFAKHLPFVHGYRVHAIFASSNQLKAGSPVRIAGVDVGKVSDVSRGPGSTMDVTLDIAGKGLPIHRDATVKIKPRLFLEGGFFVALDPGSPSAPKLRSGGTIPLPQTTTPVQFHQILSALDHDTRAQFKSTLRVTAGALDKGSARSLRALAPQLAPAFKDVAIVSQSLLGTAPHDLSPLIGSTAKVTSTLAEHDTELAGAVTGLNRTTAALASADGSLAATIREGDALLRSAPADLAAFRSALPPLAEVSAAVLPAMRIAPPVLDKTSAFLTQLAGLSSKRELRGLVDQLAPTLQGFPTFEQRLNTLFPLVEAGTDCVEQRLIPTVNEKVPDGALSSGRSAFQDLVHGLVGLASASQDFDGNGPWIRYLGAAGTETISLGSLVGNSNQPITGSRPVWLGPLDDSVYRPDVPCTTQAPPDLTARASTALATRAVSSYRVLGRTRPVAQTDLRALLRDPLKALKGLRR